MNNLTERILKATAFNLCDSVFWRCDGEYAPVTFMAICNDTFWWGTADCEKITEENIGVFEQSIEDSKDFAMELFVARVRKMRPMNCFCKGIQDPKVLEMFNACGPERNKDLFNP